MNALRASLLAVDGYRGCDLPEGQASKARLRDVQHNTIGRANVSAELYPDKLQSIKTASRRLYYHLFLP